MRHPKAMAWEKRLKAVFDGIDARLESEYGGRYPLHPARPEHGATCSRAQDGLFNIGAAFSAGFGSQRGRGYVVQVGMATLADVPAEVVVQIEDRVVDMLREELPKEFPNRKLSVERDGPVFKIVGDLSLGTV